MVAGMPRASKKDKLSACIPFALVPSGKARPMGEPRLKDRKRSVHLVMAGIAMLCRRGLCILGRESVAVFANYHHVTSVNTKKLAGSTQKCAGPFLSDGERKPDEASEGRMMSKLKGRGPVGISQLSRGLGQVLGFPPTGKSKCKDLKTEVSNFFFNFQSLLVAAEQSG